MTQSNNEAKVAHMVAEHPLLKKYITELDGLMAGSRGVRRMFTAEIEDHLSEHFLHHLDAGATPDEAARAAITAMGPPRTFATFQRETLQRRFLRVALVTAVTWTLLSLLVRSLGESVTEGAVVGILVGGVVFGLFMGWFLIYVATPRYTTTRTERSPPSRVVAAADSGGSTDEGASATSTPFLVAHRPFTRLMGVVMVIAFSLMLVSTMGAALGVRAIGLGWTQPQGLLLSILLAPTIALGLTSGRTFLVDSQGFWVSGFLQTRRVGWSEVIDVCYLSDLQPVPPVPYWKTVEAIGYTSADGKDRFVTVYPEMTDAGELLYLARTHAQAYRTQAPPSGNQNSAPG